MKWYSISEYEPILADCCVLLAVRNKVDNSISLVLGSFNENEWINFEYGESIDDDYNEVIYFCYPDPIPKVYEKLVESQDTK